MQGFKQTPSKTPVQAKSGGNSSGPGPALQKRSMVQGKSFAEAEQALMPGADAVQAKGQLDGEDVHGVASRGVAGAGGSLPHLGAIQASFGRHSVGGIKAQVGGAAAEATGALGASAYATGDRVAFGSSPDLHTAAHEAAHVVQQRSGVSLYGGVGKAGDTYERHADAVADMVVQGKSAEGLLDTVSSGSGGGGGAEGPVQMYSRVPVGKQKTDHWNAGVDLRVADDGRIAVADGTHQMWAATDVIAASDMQLMAQKSPFSLTIGSSKIKGKVPGKKGAQVELSEVTPINYENGSQGDTMRTIEACSSHGQQLMGSGMNQGSHSMETGMAAVTEGPNGEEERRYDKRGGTGNGRTDTNIMADLRGEMSGKSKEEGEKGYKNMSDKRRKEKAKELGINQYAEPEVGEGLAVYAAVSELKKSFPMHFVPVVAKSGGDYVTLENYAKSVTERKPGDTTLSSNDWYFKMFGPAKKGDDQSFYGENVKQGDYGGKKGTMVVKHRSVEGYDETPEVLRCKQISDKCEVWARTAGIREYPSFQAAWSPMRLAYTAARGELTQAWTEGRDPDQQIMDTLTQRCDALEQTQACQDLMADRVPTPEVVTPVVDDSTIVEESVSDNDD